MSMSLIDDYYDDDQAFKKQGVYICAPLIVPTTANKESVSVKEIEDMFVVHSSVTVNLN